jgi:hypothetical protein
MRKPSKLDRVLLPEEKSGGNKTVKHKTLYKLGISAAVAFPELYFVLTAEKQLGLIPSYEYNLAYVQHAMLTIPILYAVAIAGSYIDVSLFSSAASRLYRYLRNRPEKLQD